MNIPPSMDFPGRSTISPQEIAKKLSCTIKHILNHIEDGSLPAIDLKGAGATRHTYRIPLEAYRAFVAKRLTTSLL